MGKVVKTSELLDKATEFFRNEVVAPHINSALKRASNIRKYNVNPFLSNYLAYFLEGNNTKESVAKALIYPRILGTSIVTIFGDKAQKMISYLFDIKGSIADGIDIEFVDAVDKRRKYCQLKSGPNNINKGDVAQIKENFKDVRNLARTNKLKSVGIDDLIVGVLYGKPSDLSTHYKEIQKTHPVFIGQEFWYRLTGKKKFYDQLINAIGTIALEVDGREKLAEAIKALTLQL
jgi:type II restriction endonuclease EcoO109I-like protein